MTLQRLAARFPSISLVWADGGYANHIGTTLIAWAKDTLRLVLQIVKRSDDVKGFQVLPHRVSQRQPRRPQFQRRDRVRLSRRLDAPAQDRGP